MIMTASLSFDDLETLFTDVTLLGSAHEKGVWGHSFISICEQGNESSSAYPSVARIVQLILDNASTCLQKLGKDEGQSRSYLEELNAKRPFIYQSDYAVDIINNAPAYLADRTHTQKPLNADFVMATLRVKSTYMAHMKIKRLDLNSVEDPVIRSAVRVAAAFENLFRAALVREVARSEQALLELHEATLASLQELDKWAYPEKYPDINPEPAEPQSPSEMQPEIE